MYLKKTALPLKGQLSVKLFSISQYARIYYPSLLVAGKTEGIKTRHIFRMRAKLPPLFPRYYSLPSGTLYTMNRGPLPFVMRIPLSSYGEEERTLERDEAFNIHVEWQHFFWQAEK